MPSKIFGKEKPLSGRQYRTGVVGTALGDTYRDLDRAFSAVECLFGGGAMISNEGASASTVLRVVLGKVPASGTFVGAQLKLIEEGGSGWGTFSALVRKIHGETETAVSESLSVTEASEPVVEFAVRTNTLDEGDFLVADMTVPAGNYAFCNIAAQITLAK